MPFPFSSRSVLISEKYSDEISCNILLFNQAGLSPIFSEVFNECLE